MLTTHFVANIHVGAHYAVRHAENCLHWAFLSRWRIQILIRRCNRQTIFTIVPSTLENPYLPTKHHALPLDPPQGGSGGRSPPGLISAKHLSHFHPLSPATPNITTSSLPSVAPKSPSFTPFFARFPPYSWHPTKTSLTPRKFYCKIATSTSRSISRNFYHGRSPWFCLLRLLCALLWPQICRE